MQNGTPNGTSQHDERVTPVPSETFRVSPKPEPAETVVAFMQTPGEPRLDGIVDTNNEEPPSKKRKLAESKRSTPRPISPPWKKVGVEGPTSFIEGGRRKSSRTNAIPLQLQPASTKRQTRGAQTTPAVSSPLSSTPVRTSTSGRRSLGAKTGANGTASNGEKKETRRKSSSRLSLSGTANLETPQPATSSAKSRTRAQITAKTAVNRASSRHTRRNASISNAESPSASRDLDTPVKEDAHDYGGDLKVPRLRLKLKKGSVSVQQPNHIVRPKSYSSFRDWVYATDTLAGENVIATSEEAQQEAVKRLRILEAGEPGGLLSPQVCSACLPEPQEEPPIQYSHHDHLVAHALFFRKLLDQEHRRHRNTARQFAHWCAEAWRRKINDQRIYCENKWRKPKRNADKS